MGDPVTRGGRILEIAMDVYGLVVIGALTASIGAYFIGLAQKQFDDVEEDEAEQDGGTAAAPE